MLKKEFQQKDVNRMRNLISGKTLDKTATQAGYEKHQDFHKEGDVWEEKGKKWTIKNGIKQTITKFDKIKELAILPLSCPNCNKAMKLTDLNKKMYTIHRKCFDCVIEMETALKAKGEYLEYEKRMMNANKDGMLEDLERALDAWMHETDTFVSEDGVVEDWSGKQDKAKVYDEFKEAIKKGRETEI
jgi:hypothetical protein